MFKRKGEGVKGLLNNVKKNCTFLSWRLPLSLYKVHQKVRKFASIDQNGPKFRVLYAKKFTGLKKVHHRRLWRLWLIWAMLISLGSIKKLLRRNIKQMSSLIFGLKTRLLTVGARRATSICYQCNEGPFSWNQCDLMSFPILLLIMNMLNIADLFLQKENQKLRSMREQ